MGNSNSSKTNELGLGRHSTAKEVVEKCGKGDYLKGTTAIVTGKYSRAFRVNSLYMSPSSSLNIVLSYLYK